LATPYDIVRLGSVASTQDVAKVERSISGRPTLVVADRQTAGRGRQGRNWEQPRRGMFSSFSFESTWPAAARPLITLCTAMALAEAIDDIVGVAADVKWPNDLLLHDRKIAGILVESSGDIVTVGCGVNLWWPDPPSFAGAVFSDDPGSEPAGRLAEGWADRLVGHLDAGPRGWPRSRYLSRSWTIDREVTWDGGEGRAVGIDAAGGLIVATADGQVVITAGEVHTRERR